MFRLWVGCLLFAAVLVTSVSVPVNHAQAGTSVITGRGAVIDPPRLEPRFSNSIWDQIAKAAVMASIADQYGHRPKFTPDNIELFVEFASDRDYDRFWTAKNNGNHKRARKIFRDFVTEWWWWS